MSGTSRVDSSERDPFGTPEEIRQLSAMIGEGLVPGTDLHQRAMDALGRPTTQRALLVVQWMGSINGKRPEIRQIPDNTRRALYEIDAAYRQPGAAELGRSISRVGIDYLEPDSTHIVKVVAGTDERIAAALDVAHGSSFAQIALAVAASSQLRGSMSRPVVVYDGFLSGAQSTGQKGLEKSLRLGLPDKHLTGTESVWPRTMRRRAQVVASVANRLGEVLPGIASLLTILGEVSVEAIETAHRLATSATYVDPVIVPKVRPPKTDKQPSKPVLERVPNRKTYDMVMSMVSLEVPAPKDFKSHELRGVLVNGGKVTLGQEYVFSGFGENAQVAAAILNKLASFPEDEHLPMRIRQLVHWMGDIGSALSNEFLDADQRHELSAILVVLKSLRTASFRQVVTNIAGPKSTYISALASRLRAYSEQADELRAVA